MPDFAKSLFGFGGFSKSGQGAAGGSSAHRSGTATPKAGPQPGTFTPATGQTTTTALTTSSPEAAAPGAPGPSGLETVRPSMAEPSQQPEHQQISADALANLVTEDKGASTLAGKLKVRIIEARGLVTLGENSMPYVVATFDTSEFITHGPSGQPTEFSSGGGGTNGRGSSGSDGSGGSAHDNSHSRAPSTGGIAIPSKSRQSSSLALSKLATQARGNPANPTWKDEAQFDVAESEKHPVLDISVYDSRHGDAFLGHARFEPDFFTSNKRFVDRWLPLEARVPGERVTGEVRVSVLFEKAAKKHIGPEDFEILRLVGKGTFGQVYQVRKKDTKRIYAMKVLSKKAIVQKKEVAHTIGERNILVRTASTDSAFIVGLKFSFQTPSDLYLVTDYMSGGELFWHLQKEGRFDERRAKFYIAELILALEHLHDNDIVYRDLKPENILLDANGHVALCDFGLSKANLNDGGTTNTFCGTTEYLAPEVLLDDQGYTKMVDFWSLGVLVFEMCCGWSPFYAEDNQQMYKNIAFGKVRFPKDALSPEGRNFVKGLLNRNPKHRLGATDDARELRAHPFFADVDWEQLRAKKMPPPFKPQVSSETDTSNFDPEFTQASTSALHRAFMPMGTTPLSPGIQAKFQGFTYVDESLDEHMRARAGAGAGLGESYVPRSYVPHDDDIDLYDETDLQASESHYRNGLGRGDDAMEQDDGDVGMMDDDHDFVNGQGFEM